MMTVCAECGKRIVVTWPEFYVYKRGKGEDTCYFCSENCMIVADTREMKDRIGWVDPQAEMTEEEIEAVTHGRPVGFRRLRKTARREEQPAAPAGQERTGQEMGNGMNCNKLTRAQKEKAVQIAISGGDPLDWLRTCGAKNPSAAWFYIKKTVAKADPKLYEKIPEKTGMVINESGQAVPADIQTPAGEGDPSTAPGGSAQDDTKDALEGFQVMDVNRQKKPEDDLVINAEDLAAAEDPAVRRMEAYARMEKTDRVPPVAGRLVMDERGLHTVKAEDPPKPEKSWLAEIAEKVPDVDAGERPAAVARDPSTSVGMTAQGALKERSELIHDANGVRMVTERLLDDLPCVITGLKVNEFEFNLNRAGMVLILPESDRDFMQLQVTLRPDQWMRLVEVVPKVMQILRIE